MVSLETKCQILEAVKKEPGKSLEQILPGILPVSLAEAADELCDAGYIEADINYKTYIHGSAAIENVRITEKGIRYLDSLNSFFNASAS